MKNTSLPLSAAVAVFGSVILAGCFTVRETEFPATAMCAPVTNAVGRTVAVRGFEAQLTEYMTVYGYDTVYVPGHYGRRHYHPGHYETMRTQTSVPRVYATDIFLNQARDRFEESGFVIEAPTPDYVVEVKFSGPQEGEIGYRALWLVLSAFTVDSAEQTWGAKLKIHDNRTGRLLFSRDYAETYRATGFSPIPLFGIACYERTDDNYMQCWCLRALTDRVTADASAFLSAL